MSILTLLFIITVIWAIYLLIKAFGSTQETLEKSLRKIKYVKSIGLFALIIGVLAQLIGFYQAFSAIEQVGSISPKMMFGGIKISLISTIYGVIIYLISFLLWLGSTLVIERMLKSNI